MTLEDFKFLTIGDVVKIKTFEEIVEYEAVHNIQGLNRFRASAKKYCGKQRKVTEKHIFYKAVHLYRVTDEFGNRISIPIHAIEFVEEEWKGEKISFDQLL